MRITRDDSVENAKQVFAGEATREAEEKWRGKVEKLTAQLSQTTEDLAEALERQAETTILLRDVLLALRVRAVAGWQRERCLACNRPHTVLPCNCVHHRALAWLKEKGVEIEM